MGKRAAGLLIRVPEGTTHVGTATVRDVLRAAMAPAKKPSKFHNVGAVRGEIKFDSKREAKRYDELVTLEALGIISNLKLQVPFVIAEATIVAGKKAKARQYVADFVYETAGERVVEDVKGMLTPEYRLKRHLMKSVLGIDILETK